MPHHHDIKHSPYSPKQIFDLVADVARYPEFLPWCRAARILRWESDHVFYAELIISYKHLSERYTSRVTLIPTDETHAEHRINVEMTEGPFHHLTNKWRFTTKEGGGAHIEFDLDFAFRSRILDALLGHFFTSATAKMSDAFLKRADALYGNR